MTHHTTLDEERASLGYNESACWCGHRGLRLVLETGTGNWYWNANESLVLQLLV